jgi:RHS repeat-associated protein
LGCNGDHLGNVRLSYTDNNNDGVIQTDGANSEIVEESNYYPFGLKHKGYNNVKNIGIGNARAQKWGYQGQEEHDELGLNVNEFKYRFYDPAIGRFWSIDPLSEDYAYNSTYAFAENKLGMGIELEGRELLGNDIIFAAIRLGQQGLQSIKEKFNNGSEKVSKAYNEQMKQKAGIPNPEFDSESSRIDMAVGAGQVGEATLDAGHLTADVAGTIDPSGIIDGVHSLTYLPGGEYGKASLTAMGMLAYVGDGTKMLKYTDELADVTMGTAELTRKGVLELDFNVPEALRGNGIGTKMFNSAIETFGDGIKSIKGTWIDGDNLSVFQKVFKETGDINKAIFSTPTGKWAERSGFGSATITRGHVGENGYEGLEVMFNKSN